MIVGLYGPFLHLTKHAVIIYRTVLQYFKLKLFNITSFNNNYCWFIFILQNLNVDLNILKTSFKIFRCFEHKNIHSLFQIQACRRFGATVVVEGNDMKEAKQLAMAKGRELGLTYINGFVIYCVLFLR